METVGELLRDYMEAEGVTQTDLAEALGVKQATVSRWLTEGAIPDVLSQNAKAIQKLLRISEAEYALADVESRRVRNEARRVAQRRRR